MKSLRINNCFFSFLQSNQCWACALSWKITTYKSYMLYMLLCCFFRTLKENNRRLREKYDKSDRYLRDAEDELEKANKKLKKYKVGTHFKKKKQLPFWLLVLIKSASVSNTHQVKYWKEFVPSIFNGFNNGTEMKWIK